MRPYSEVIGIALRDAASEIADLRRQLAERDAEVERLRAVSESWQGVARRLHEALVLLRPRLVHPDLYPSGDWWHGKRECEAVHAEFQALAGKDGA